MNSRTYLIVSGVIFGLISIGQLMRLIFQVPIQISTLIIPVWPSALVLIGVLLMCIWAFRLASKS